MSADAPARQEMGARAQWLQATARESKSRRCAAAMSLLDGLELANWPLNEPAP